MLIHILVFIISSFFALLGFYGFLTQVPDVYNIIVNCVLVILGGFLTGNEIHIMKLKKERDKL